jgi:hypothetical protein
VFSARCLFFGKGHAPAGSSTAVEGARVHLSHQEEYMTVSLILSANFGFCTKVQVQGVSSTAVMGPRVQLR